MLVTGCASAHRDPAAQADGGINDSGVREASPPGEAAAPAEAAAPPPHVVRPCIGPDGGAGGPGVWEEITPAAVNLDPAWKNPNNAGTNGGVGVFVLDPQDTANIYLGTSAQGIYKSTDCGSTWAKVNTGMNGADLDKGGQWTMAIDPVDPRGVIYTNSGYGPMGLYKSTNGGVDWQQILPTDVFVYGGFVHNISLDPTNPQHLVVSPHFTCEGSHSMYCLLETQNGGTDWNVIENAPPNGEQAGEVVIDNSTWFFAEGFGGLQRTTDQGQTWTGVANPQGYAFAIMVHPDGGSYFLPAGPNMITSPDGVTWTTLQNSPGSFFITSSTTTIFVSSGPWCTKSSDGTELFYEAPLSDPTNWTQIRPSPPMTYAPASMQYDEDRGILYASSCNGGFWRVAIR
jgi:photosystem II stability/assembly factor-like uncharacterized protein